MDFRETTVLNHDLPVFKTTNCGKFIIFGIITTCVIVLISFKIDDTENKLKFNTEIETYCHTEDFDASKLNIQLYSIREIILIRGFI